jgi:hypothetical protein
MSIFRRSHGSRCPQGRIFRDGSSGKGCRNNVTGDGSSLNLSLAIIGGAATRSGAAARSGAATTGASAAIAARAVETASRGRAVILGSVEQDIPAMTPAVVTTTVRTLLVFPADLKRDLAFGSGTVGLARNGIALAV